MEPTQGGSDCITISDELVIFEWKELMQEAGYDSHNEFAKFMVDIVWTKVRQSENCVDKCIQCDVEESAPKNVQVACEPIYFESIEEINDLIITTSDLKGEKPLTSVKRVGNQQNSVQKSETRVKNDENQLTIDNSVEKIEASVEKEEYPLIIDTSVEYSVGKEENGAMPKYIPSSSIAEAVHVGTMFGNDLKSKSNEELQKDISKLESEVDAARLLLGISERINTAEINRKIASNVKIEHGYYTEDPLFMVTSEETINSTMDPRIAPPMQREKRKRKSLYDDSLYDTSGRSRMVKEDLWTMDDGPTSQLDLKTAEMKEKICKKLRKFVDDADPFQHKPDDAGRLLWCKADKAGHFGFHVEPVASNKRNKVVVDAVNSMLYSDTDQPCTVEMNYRNRRPGKEGYVQIKALHMNSHHIPVFACAKHKREVPGSDFDNLFFRVVSPLKVTYKFDNDRHLVAKLNIIDEVTIMFACRNTCFDGDLRHQFKLVFELYNEKVIVGRRSVLVNLSAGPSRDYCNHYSKLFGVGGARKAISKKDDSPGVFTQLAEHKSKESTSPDIDELEMHHLRELKTLWCLQMYRMYTCLKTRMNIMDFMRKKQLTIPYEMGPFNYNGH